MNIVLVNQWYSPKNGFGGVAKYNYYLSYAYKKLGHNVFIISKLTKESKRYVFRDGIHIFRIKQLNFFYIFSKVPYLCVFFRFLRDLMYSFCVWQKLKALHKKFKIDIVEYAEINYEGLFHSLFWPKIPFIVRCHTPYFILKDYYLKKELSFDSPFIYLAEKIFIKKAPYLTVPSKNLAEIIIRKFKIPSKKIMVIPNAIDIEKFSSFQVKEKKDKIILLFVGRLERSKGVFVLAEAFCKLAQIYNKIRCIFVGEDRGALLKLKEIFLKNNLIERVEFKGKVKEEELIKIYKTCDIFINPSLIYESFSYTCLEALASGKPVIASRIGGISEVVDDGKAGFLFEPANTEQLFNRLKILIEDSQKREEFGREGERKVKEYFDILKIASKNLEIYKKICKVR